MTAPRVLLISNHAELVGGGEISLLLLLDGLRRQGLWDLRLAVPGPGPVAARAAALQVPVVEIPLPRIRSAPWRLRTASRAVGRRIDELEPALVHANGSRAMLLAGRAARARGLPVVWHVRVEPSELIDAWLSRHAAVVVAPSRAVAARFPRKDVRVIPNPVVVPQSTGATTSAATPGGSEPEDAAGGAGPDSRAVAVDRRSTPTRTGGEAERAAVLLVAARLSPDRGHDRVLDALARMPSERPWRLIVAGGADPHDPGHAAHLEARVKAAGWSDRVEFVGFRDDVFEFMRGADLLLHAPDEEGFGRVYVEAMAAGLPAVVTPAGGLREIHAETGYGWMAGDLTPAALAEAICAALDDAEGRRLCHQRGPLKARSLYSVEVHARRIAELYRQLLGP